MGECQSSITHIGSPVNPMTAKALASKLNERNNLLNGLKKPAAQSTRVTSKKNSNEFLTKEIPMPPLISIQTLSASSSNRMTGIDCLQSTKNSLKSLMIQERNRAELVSKEFHEKLSQRKEFQASVFNQYEIPQHTDSETVKQKKIFSCDLCTLQTIFTFFYKFSICRL